MALDNKRIAAYALAALPVTSSCALANDIMIFDPTTIANTDTFENANQLVVGARTVIFNGVITVRDGNLKLDTALGLQSQREQMQ